MYNLMINNKVIGKFNDVSMAKLVMDMLIEDDNIYNDFNNYAIKKVEG